MAIDPSFVLPDNNQIVGVAAVHTRDTEHDQPTQRLGARLGSWLPIMDSVNPSIAGAAPVDPANSIIDRVKSVLPVTSGVDPGTMYPMNTSTSGYWGGSLPDHSNHWTDYLTSMWNMLPTGKASGFVTQPDPTPVMGMVSQDQQAVTANGEDPWHTILSNFRKMWTKGAPPSTYKLPHP